MTTVDLDNLFNYHAPTDDQIPKYNAIREAGRMLASVILKQTPASADQTAAIRKVREAVMTANAAIACEVPTHVPRTYSALCPSCRGKVDTAGPGEMVRLCRSCESATRGVRGVK